MSFQTLHRYLTCTVLCGDYEGQQTDCSNATGAELPVTHISVGDEAPRYLEVAFHAEGLKDIKDCLKLKRLKGQIGVYERTTTKRV